MNIQTGNANATVAEPPTRSPEPITAAEFRSMEAALVRHLGGRARSLLGAFADCVGKHELTVSVSDMSESCDAGHLTIPEIVRAVNDRWYCRNIPFHISAEAKRGHQASAFTLKRKDHCRKTIAQKAPSAERAEYAPFDESARGPEDSDLTNAQWEMVLRKIIETSPSGRARNDKDHPLLNKKLMREIFDARPHPVRLSKLDAILVEAGSITTRMWGSRADIVNSILGNAGLPFRIKKKPTQRILRSIPLAEGDVTLYVHIPSEARTAAAQRQAEKRTKTKPRRRR